MIKIFTLLLVVVFVPPCLAQSNVQRQIEIDQARIQAMSALGSLDLHHDTTQAIESGLIVSPPPNVVQQGKDDVQLKTKYWNEWMAGLPK